MRISRTVGCAGISAAVVLAMGLLSFFEVKTDVRRLDLGVLRRKSEAFFAKNPEKRSAETTFGGLSIEDM